MRWIPALPTRLARTVQSMADLQLDHVGVQVADLEQAAALFERALGYQRVTTPVVNSLHGVRGLFMEKPGGIAIKLITPVDENSGPVSVGAHHLAFLTDDIEAAIVQLRADGARLIKRPRPGEMFDGNPIAFLMVAGVNIELVTTRAWRDRIESLGHMEPDSPDTAIAHRDG